MRSFLLLVAVFTCNLLPGRAVSAEHRARWLRDARWGVMTHYLADWIARRDGGELSVERWNEMIDRFDVERLAEQLHSLGAGYYLITIGQNSGYYLSPNATYDEAVEIKPSRCARRDLVADLSIALRKHRIPLLVYLPAGASAGDRIARTELQWQQGPHRNQEFQRKWEEIIGEWSTRWGDGVAGWWFDGCYWPNAMYRHEDAPNFASFAAAARSGNPASIVTFNPGVYTRILSVTPHEDYTAGEINEPYQIEFKRVENGLRDGAQLHILSYLGRTWGTGEPRFATEKVIEYSRTVWDNGGAVTWDVPIETRGIISEPFAAQLRAIGQAMDKR